jgi:hypothetical protein
VLSTQYPAELLHTGSVRFLGAPAPGGGRLVAELSEVSDGEDAGVEGARTAGAGFDPSFLPSFCRGTALASWLSSTVYRISWAAWCPLRRGSTRTAPLASPLRSLSSLTFSSKGQYLISRFVAMGMSVEDAYRVQGTD